MKVLSWDVGVKNLAGCILEFEPLEKKKSKSEKLKARIKPTDEELLDIYWGPIGKA